MDKQFKRIIKYKLGNKDFTALYILCFIISLITLWFSKIDIKIALWFLFMSYLIILISLMSNKGVRKVYYKEIKKGG